MWWWVAGPRAELAQGRAAGLAQESIPLLQTILGPVFQRDVFGDCNVKGIMLDITGVPSINILK